MKFSSLTIFGSVHHLPHIHSHTAAGESNKKCRLHVRKKCRHRHNFSFRNCSSHWLVEWSEPSRHAILPDRYRSSAAIHHKISLNIFSDSNKLLCSEGERENKSLHNPFLSRHHVQQLNDSIFLFSVCCYVHLKHYGEDQHEKKERKVDKKSGRR